MRRSLCFATSLVLFLTLSLSLSAKTLYVKTTGNDAYSGLNWASAKKTVQRAINAAAYGDEIWVVRGLYNQSITIKNGIKIFGGFVGNETSRSQRNPDKNETILNGSGGSVVTFQRGCETSTVIDGFTIQNGVGTTVSEYGVGGGVFCTYGSPVISNNVITNNLAADAGGGIYLYRASPLITHNLITQNHVGIEEFDDGSGGGMYCVEGAPKIIGNDIIENYGAYYGDGGGIVCSRSDATIAENRIISNGTVVDGGGIFCSDGHVVISNNIIQDNWSWRYTGGGICTSGEGSVAILNNLITGNYANDVGGGIAAFNDGELSIVNNTIVDNHAADGGGICMSTSQSANVANNIIAFCSSGIFGSALFKNNDVYGNSYYDYDYYSAGPGEGDISLDPLFVDRANGNYHLQTGSPCIDTGFDGAVEPGEVDLDGSPRIYGPHVDMGAYEWHPIAPVNKSLSPGSGYITTSQWTTITTTYADANGADDIYKGGILINKTSLGTSARNGVFLRYDRTENKLYLKSSDDSSWGIGYEPGTDAILSNNQCEVSCKDTTVTPNGSDLTIGWRIRFKANMIGWNCYAWMYVIDMENLSQGWSKKATYVFK